MTTHALLIGARDRGHMDRIRASALAQNERVLTKFAPESLMVTTVSSSFDFIQFGELEHGGPTTVLIEDIDGVTNECVDELVQKLLVWTGNHRELPVTFYWDIIGLAPERTVELIEKLLSLVMLG